MSSKEDENWSLWISSTLDIFGFNHEIISFRSDYFNKISENISSKYELICPCRLHLVGSTGEGFRQRNSDLDILGVLKNTVCLDNLRVIAHLNILKTDYPGTAPGYTKLVLINKSSQDVRHPFHFDTMYKSTDGYSYIPSAALEYFANFVNVADFAEMNGPAISLPGLLSYTIGDTDLVGSVYYVGKEHLNKWANRSRYNVWPRPAVINEISKMEGYIVPVGDKESDFKSLEWRICYTTAEKKLVGSLNISEEKLYILLKMICKTILKPVCKAITSYIVKNVVFWIAEGTPEQQHSVKRLVNLLQRSLNFIKYCLENNHLPNYMMPERNLIRGGVFGKEKQSAIEVLSELIKEGGSIIVRIPNLHQCMSLMVMNPERVLQYGHWRQDVEKRAMQMIVRRSQNWAYFLPLPFWLKILISKDMNFMEDFKFLMLVVPELPEMALQGEFEKLVVLFIARLEATMLL